MSKSSLSKIPFWDGKTESFGVYVSKIEAYTKIVGMGYALDPILVKNCPTQSEFVVLDITIPDNQELIDLYQVN